MESLMSTVLDRASALEVIRRAVIEAAIARIDSEIAEMERQTDAPAYLVTIGIEDLRAERRMIEREAS